MNDSRGSFSVLPPLLIAAVVIAAYSNSMIGPFVFDDFDSIVKNKSIRSVWPLSQSLWAAQDAPTAGRPVVNLSFALNYAAGKFNVFGYHLVNVVLHCFNAAILFAFTRRTLVRVRWGQEQPGLAWWASIAIAALWALHPIQTETVSYITQRTELGMAFFFLATMYTASRVWDAESRIAKMVWQSACIGSCALGMGSKEVMVVAPLMVVLYDLSIMKIPLVQLVKLRWTLYVGLAATWGILAALMATDPRGRSVGFELGIKPLDYLTTQFWAITHYLWLTIWPFELSGDYGILVVTKLGAWLPCLLLLIVLLAVTVLAWFRWRSLSLLGGWFFLILAPTSSIVPISTEPVAERRMYLPLAAIVVLVVLGLVECIKRLPLRSAAASGKWSIFHKRLFLLSTLALFVVCVWTTYARNAVYESELTFWQDVIQKRPDNSRGFSNLGIIYAKNKQPESAKISFLQAIELSSANADAHSELGFLYADQGTLNEAMHSYNRALTINPRMTKTLVRRGLLLSRLKRWDEAIEDLQIAIKVDPSMPGPYFELGNIYLASKQFGEAIENYRAAIGVDPSFYIAYHNLGSALARQGEYREAIDSIEKAEEFEPLNADAYSNLGFCYNSLNEYRQAIAAYQHCVALQPNDAQAWYRLGKVFVSTGDVSESRRCFERVLQIDPKSVEARRQLEQLDKK